MQQLLFLVQPISVLGPDPVPLFSKREFQGKSYCMHTQETAIVQGPGFKSGYWPAHRKRSSYEWATTRVAKENPFLTFSQKAKIFSKYS